MLDKTDDGEYSTWINERSEYYSTLYDRNILKSLTIELLDEFLEPITTNSLWELEVTLGND